MHCNLCASWFVALIGQERKNQVRRGVDGLLYARISALPCVQCTLHTTKGELPHFADLNSLFETEIHSTTEGASLKAKV